MRLKKPLVLQQSNVTQPQKYIRNKQQELIYT